MTNEPVMSINSLFYEMQSIRAILDGLVKDMKVIQMSYIELEKRQDVTDKILIIGNGELPLREQMRNVNSAIVRLESSITSFIITHEAEEKRKEKKVEDYRDKWYWEIVKALLPAGLAFLATYFAMS